MTISGSFYDTQNRQVTVTFVSEAEGSDITIGEGGLHFSGDPVHIRQDVDDSTTHLIMRSCEIGLVTKDYVGDLLWSPAPRYITCKVERENETLFDGYVEPMTFSQPFTYPIDGFTVNAIDKVAALQYENYRQARGDTYEALRSAADVVTAKAMLTAMLPSGNIYYDNSKAVEQGRESTLLDDVAVNELIFFGDDVDNMDTMEDALTKMLRYLNLHLMQIGDDFFVFDWGTVRAGNTSWTEIRTGDSVTLTMPLTHLTTDMHGAADTQITVGEAYNQVSVQCSLDDDNDTIINLLDDDTLSSRWTNKQLYCREYMQTSGNMSGNDNRQRFRQWMYNGVWTGPEADTPKAKDWYIRLLEAKGWELSVYGGGLNQWGYDWETDENGVYINQHLPAYNNMYRTYSLGLYSFGSVDTKPATQDNEPIGKITMSNYIYISINQIAGSGIHPLEWNTPLMTYTGGSGGTFSPVDDATTNYIVFTGSIQLQPVVPTSKAWSQVYGPGGTNDFGTVDTGVDGKRLYVRRFIDKKYPSDRTVLQNGRDASLVPPVEGAPQSLRYNRSVDWMSSDLIAKLPVLECELIIGNKRLVETDMDEYGNSTFRWYTLGQEPTATYEGETYTLTTFSLGINPKVGDYILGTEYNLQNTVNIDMNLNVEGTAIPIKKSDNLSGAVSFRILGAINTTYDNAVRRHPTWFRHTTWTTTAVSLLSHVNNIIIKDLRAQTFSDNANNDVLEEKDLIYISDEDSRYINRLEAADMDIITQPTSDECAQLGIKNAVFTNAAIDARDNSLLGRLYNAVTGENAKAEQHYVDAYWHEFHMPRIRMSATLHDDTIAPLGRYESTPLHRSFTPLSLDHDVRMCETNITLKEIPN